MVSSSTSSTDSSACGWIRSWSSAKVASRTRPGLSASRPDSLLMSTVTTSPTDARVRRRLPGLEHVVGRDDAADQLVPDDVVVGQVVERDVVDVVEDRLHLAEPAAGAAGQVHLRD